MYLALVLMSDSISLFSDALAEKFENPKCYDCKDLKKP
jgi:hypothetical protein